MHLDIKLVRTRKPWHTWRRQLSPTAILWPTNHRIISRCKLQKFDEIMNAPPGTAARTVPCDSCLIGNFCLCIETQADTFPAEEESKTDNFALGNMVKQTPLTNNSSNQGQSASGAPGGPSHPTQTFHSIKKFD